MDPLTCNNYINLRKKIDRIIEPLEVIWDDLKPLLTKWYNQGSSIIIRVTSTKISPMHDNVNFSINLEYRSYLNMLAISSCYPYKKQLQNPDRQYIHFRRHQCLPDRIYLLQRNKLVRSMRIMIRHPIQRTIWIY